MFAIWTMDVGIYGGLMNIYDFDGTIYDGDSSLDFFKYCLSKNKKIILDIIPICFSLILYLLKFIEKEKFKSTFFRFVKRIDLDKYVDEFWKENDFKIKSFYKKNHLKSDIVISASPSFLLQPLAEKYDFTLIATEIDKTCGKVNNKNCYGSEKLERLKNMGITKCDKFYSNSLSDLPCALLAKKAYIVSKDKIISWEDYKLSKKREILNTYLNRDFFSFVFIGCINAFNGIWIAYVYSLFVLNPVVAYILGFLSSLIISYILNSKLNFKNKLTFNKFIKFIVNNIPNFIIQVLCVIVLLNNLHFSKILSYAVSAVIAVPITFLLVKINVFKN